MPNSQRSEGINVFLHSTHTHYLCTVYIYVIVVMQCMHLKSSVYMHDLYAFCIHTAYTHISLYIMIKQFVERMGVNNLQESKDPSKRNTSN